MAAWDPKDIRTILAGLASNVLHAGDDDTEWCWCRNEEARRRKYSGSRYHDIGCFNAHEYLARAKAGGGG